MSSHEKNTCMDDTYMENIIKINNMNKVILAEILNTQNSNFKEDKNIKVIDFINKKFKDINKQNEILNQLKKFMNENRMHDIFNDYIIDDNTTLAMLRNTFLQDNIINNMICSIDKIKLETINSYFMSLILATNIKLCTKKNLINYCNNIKSEDIIKEKHFSHKIEEVRNLVDNMTMFLKSDVNDSLVDNLTENFSNTSKKSFTTTNIKQVASSISLNSFNENEKKYLVKYINNYQKKYNYVLEIKKREDIIKIIHMIVSDCIKLIDEMKDLPRGEFNMKKAAEFIILRDIFYKMKHYYKIISYYNIIDAYVEKDIDKDFAMLCCSEEGSNDCYNFNNKLNNSEPIIMGFYMNEKESMGFIKEEKCHLPSDEEKKHINKKALVDILDKNIYFNLLSEDIKEKYLINMIKYFNYFDINIKSPNQSYNIIIEKISDNHKEFLKANYSDLLKIKSNGLNSAFNYNNKYINKFIVKINSENNIDKLESLLEKIKSDFDFRSLNNLELAKNSIIILLKLNYVLTSLGLNNISANEVIKKIFVYQINSTFEELFDEYIISKRYHKMIIKSIIEIIKSETNIIIPKELNPKSKINSIKITKNIFLVPNDLNFCNNWKDLLMIHRRERSIDNNEFIKLKQKVLDLCSKRNDKLNEMHSKSLGSDMIETNIKEVEVLDINNIKHSILVKEHIGRKIILNNVDDILKETNLYILNNNQLMMGNEKVNKSFINVENKDGDKFKMKLKDSIVSIIKDKIVKKSHSKITLGLFIVSASVIDTNNIKRKIKLYLRKEKGFELYFFMQDKSDTLDTSDINIIYKYTLDENFNFFYYNKKNSKNVINLIDINNDEFEINIIKNKLEGFNIESIRLIKEYEKYNNSVDNILKNKLYHFFGR